MYSKLHVIDIVIDFKIHYSLCGEEGIRRDRLGKRAFKIHTVALCCSFEYFQMEEDRRVWCDEVNEREGGG